MDGERELLGEPVELAVPACVALGLSVTEAVCVPRGVRLALAVPLCVMLGDCVTEGDAVALGVELGLPVEL